MINKEAIYNKIIELLSSAGVEYKLFEHRTALNYEDLAKVQQETGFFGTEGKCLVLKADGKFIVYVTIQGQKISFEKIKEKLQAAKVRLATPEELMENFGAEPGCAYPFGFDSGINIYIDPKIYLQEWLLFSPLYPKKTVQAKAPALKNLFSKLPNNVTETFDFNE